MQEIIIVKPEKCIGCNACIRVCPADEANKTVEYEKGMFVTSVNTSKCIACGECLKVCTHGARDYIDDTNECMSKIVSEKVIILVSPVLKIAYPTKWKGILEWFHHQGCFIYDVSYGADICTWATARTTEQGKLNKMISQQCPAVVNYIETYQPKLLSHLSPIHSPAACEAIYIKKYQRRSNLIAYLTPCIASKAENFETGLIDYTVTFGKLMKFFEQNGIDIPLNAPDDNKFTYDDEEGIFGILYNRPGGMRENIWTLEPDLNIAYSSGINNAYPEIAGYSKLSDAKRPDFYDVLSCNFGCTLSAGTGVNLSHFEVRNNMEPHENNTRTRSKGGLRRGDDKLFKKFDNELRLADFLRNYKSSMPSMTPSAQQLEPIYQKMNKTTADERCIDCHACGYSSCREMATAILRGLNVPTNCIYNRSGSSSVSEEEFNNIKSELNDIRTECTSIIESMNSNIADISTSAGKIDESGDSSNAKLEGVKTLLQNVVLFCNENSTMDSDSIAQLVNILETTISALGELDESINKTSESSAELNKKLSGLKDTMQNLEKTVKEEKAETEE